LNRHVYSFQSFIVFQKENSAYPAENKEHSKEIPWCGTHQ